MTSPDSPAARRLPSWKRCRTCGDYRAAGSNDAGYCSAECSRAYSTCANCGAYFRSGEGFDADHCSRECTVHYVVLKSYGPEPAYLVSEV